MFSFTTMTALLCITPTISAHQEPLADALHAVTDKCLTREGHDLCSDYASQQLSACSPDDVNCQRAKLADISQYCRSVCDNSDYVADATRSFIGPQQLLMKRSAQDFNIANTTAASEQATNVLNVLGSAEASAAAATSTHQAFKTSDLIEASALRRILDAGQVPANMSAFLKANLDPIIAKAKAEINTVIENSQLGSKEHSKAVSKRDIDDEIPSRYKITDKTTGREVNLPEKYLISKVPAEKYINEDFEDCKSDVEQSPARRPDRSYSEYYAPIPAYKEKFYGDNESPKSIEYYRNSRRPERYEEEEEAKEEEQEQEREEPQSKPEDDLIVTMYVDAPMPIATLPASPLTTSTVASKTTSGALLGLDRLKSKLNIHQVVHNNSLGWNNGTEKHHGQHYNSTAAKAEHNAGNTLVPSVNLHLILVGLAIMAAL